MEYPVRYCPAVGLWFAPDYQGRSVSELERMLADPKPAVQAQGEYGLGLQGEKARPAVPALARALTAETPLVRQQAATALGKIGPAAAEAISALVTALDDAEWSVRRQAAVALSSMGSVARTAAEAPWKDVGETRTRWCARRPRKREEAQGMSDS